MKQISTFKGNHQEILSNVKLRPLKAEPIQNPKSIDLLTTKKQAFPLLIGSNGKVVLPQVNSHSMSLAIDIKADGRI